MADRTISASWMKGIAEIMEAASLDVPALFKEVGLDYSLLNTNSARYPTDKVSQVWNLAVERSNNPAIGVALAGAVKPAIYDVVSYVMMSCENLRASLDRLHRYLHIFSDSAAITLRDDDQGCWLILEVFGSGQPVPRQRVEFCMATFLTFCRWITGRNLQVAAVHFSYPDPADTQAYIEHFQSPLRFNAEFNGMHFLADDLVRPLPSYSPALLELHDRYAGDYLTRLDNNHISYRVREMIVRRLPDGCPTRAEVASAMCMGERTLQRRLQEEQTSFQELVDDIRRELAQNYLGQSHLGVAQAAYLLGFSEPSTFFHACKRWFNMSPGQYRAQLDANAD